MNCPRCERLRSEQKGVKDEICVCGFNFETPGRSTIHANEEFIFFNTRTSHKRYESMVLYALHFALRNVEILSQHAVNAGNDVYFIDAYIPELNLAIEVDEPHHEYQKAADTNRENAIKHTLDCEFIRITCDDSIYAQVDNIIDLVKKRSRQAWEHQRCQPNRYSGEYSAKHWTDLTENDIPNMMDTFATKLTRQNYEIWHGSVNGIPSASNGEYGFLMKRKGLTFAVYARKTQTVRARVVNVDTSVPPSFVDSYLIPRQNKGRSPRYYAIEAQDSYQNSELALEAIETLIAHL